MASLARSLQVDGEVDSSIINYVTKDSISESVTVFASLWASGDYHRGVLTYIVGQVNTFKNIVSWYAFQQCGIWRRTRTPVLALPRRPQLGRLSVIGGHLQRSPLRHGMVFGQLSWKRPLVL